MTVLGVEDVDFFIDNRQTDLPLIGVSIPTNWFFVIAPTLATSLIVHLHMHVIKLCIALRTVYSTPGFIRTASSLKNWILIDFIEIAVLKKTKFGDMLDTFIVATVGAFVWFLGVSFMGFIWWRSWPAHDPLLTLTLGGLLVITICISSVSFGRVLTVKKSDQDGRSAIHPRYIVGIVFLVTSLGQLKSTAGYSWLDPPMLPFFQVAKQNFTSMRAHSQPKNWLPCALAKEEFYSRANHWQRDGIHLSEIEKKQLWLLFRRNQISSLGAPDLREIDIRNADFRGAFLAGVQFPSSLDHTAIVEIDALQDTHFQNFETCELDTAKIIRAGFSFSKKSGFGIAISNGAFDLATFTESDSSGSIFSDSLLFGAKFSGTKFAESQFVQNDLMQTKFDNADLTSAIFWANDLSQSKFDNARLENVDFKNSILTDANFVHSTGLTQAAISFAIGNQNTKLPTQSPPLRIPSCWGSEPRGFSTFIKIYGSTIAREHFICSRENPKRWFYGPSNDSVWDLR